MNNEHEVGNLSKNGLIFNALDLSHFNLENFAALRENGPVQTPHPISVEFSTLFFTGSHMLNFLKIPQLFQFLMYFRKVRTILTRITLLLGSPCIYFISLQRIGVGLNPISCCGWPTLAMARRPQMPQLLIWRKVNNENTKNSFPHISSHCMLQVASLVSTILLICPTNKKPFFSRKMRGHRHHGPSNPCTWTSDPSSTTNTDRQHINSHHASSHWW